MSVAAWAGRLVSGASLGAALVTAHSLVNLRLLRTPPPECVDWLSDIDSQSTHSGVGRVSVLVPARDEAGHIGPCVRALLTQRGVDVEVLVLDDESTDRTAALAVQAGGGDPRLRVLPGTAPPAGWLGKPHACRQLADAAGGDVLVFVDADVRVAPGGIAATVALLRSAGLDLVCPYPRQLTGSVAERLVQPLLQWSWLSFLPLRLAERPGPPALAAANGQLLACDAEAYRRAGGHTAVRSAVLEDVALARAFKRVGLRATVADGTDVAGCRMYRSWPQLREGYAKSLWAAFGSPARAATLVTLLAWLYLLPPLAFLGRLARGRPGAAVGPALGYAVAVAGRAACARRTGGRPGDSWTHPLSVATLGWLTAHSWRRRRTGTLRWKGRRLSEAGAPGG